MAALRADVISLSSAASNETRTLDKICSQFFNCVKIMSSRRPRNQSLLAVGSLFATLLVAGCPDTKQSFDDFDNRVIDADNDRIDGANLEEIPDVNGEFLLSLSPSIAPTALLKFIATTVLEESGGEITVALELQPLCVQEGQCTVGQPIGDPIAVAAASVNGAGEFTANLVEAFVPGGANPISGSDIIGDIELLGTLKDDDLYCGEANGTATVSGSPIPINGSTFASIRITPGTLGDDLPDPVAECPPEGGDVDAGVPDAGTPDAGIPDAGAPDAGPPDAAP